ncbi:hypothetical protein Tcan_00846, partial [Toxocara canis]
TRRGRALPRQRRELQVPESENAGYRKIWRFFQHSICCPQVIIYVLPSVSNGKDEIVLPVIDKLDYVSQEQQKAAVCPSSELFGHSCISFVNLYILLIVWLQSRIFNSFVHWLKERLSLKSVAPS